MTEIVRVGVDLAKRVIQVHAVDAAGRCVLRAGAEARPVHRLVLATGLPTADDLELPAPFEIERKLAKRAFSDPEWLEICKLVAVLPQEMVEAYVGRPNGLDEPISKNHHPCNLAP